MNATKLIDNLQKKLHPSRFSNMSPKMAWIISAIIGTDWSKGPRGESPHGAHFSITSDGHIISGNMYLGDANEFKENIDNLIKCAELSTQEQQAFDLLFKNKITDWR